jgi:ribosome maturation factor RimP
MADIVRLAELIEPLVQAMGFELVRVKMMSSEAGSEPALQVMAEDPATGQLVLDQCAALSHEISDVLDAAEEAGEVLVPGAYRLEVSSPGIDRPLTRTKDFADWAGHEAKIELAAPIEGRKRFRGTLEGIDSDSNIALTDGGRAHHSLPFEQVHSAKLVLTDKLIAATRPLDTSGAEEILEEEEG